MIESVINHIPNFKNLNKFLIKSHEIMNKIQISNYLNH
jgi:hypothetical protein